MTTTTSLLALVAAALFGATAAPAQQPAPEMVAVESTQVDTPAASDTTAAKADTAPAPATEPAPEPAAAKRARLQPKIEVQHYRPQDQRGLLIFETPKEEGVAYTGFKLQWGAAFTQQMQGLRHENTAAEKPTSIVVNGQPTTYDANALQGIGTGFNNANANLYVTAQLARGIRVALTSYLSSRHHNETWVKDGYLLIDASPLEVPALNTLMRYVTVKAGHFEVNYGDAHFRRTDNGNALYNPFVGNLIMDAFTTEIGGEVYVRANGFMGMVGVTGGEIRGNVTQPENRSPAYLAKLGFDRQLSRDLRVRLTGSTFQQRSAISNTLYAGDRAGSRYYWVMENTQATESGNFTSGLINPGFRDNVKALMLNPFVKFRGAELFATIEQARGKASNEGTNREWNQWAAEGVYRFLPAEQVYVGARYNTAKGKLQGISDEVRVDRWQAGAGWFITPGVLLKAEYVDQKYNDFPVTDIRNGGRFKGWMVEGVVSF